MSYKSGINKLGKICSVSDLTKPPSYLTSQTLLGYKSLQRHFSRTLIKNIIRNPEKPEHGLGETLNMAYELRREAIKVNISRGTAKHSTKTAINDVDTDLDLKTNPFFKLQDKEKAEDRLKRLEREAKNKYFTRKLTNSKSAKKNLSISVVPNIHECKSSESGRYSGTGTPGVSMNKHGGHRKLHMSKCNPRTAPVSTMNSLSPHNTPNTIRHEKANNTSNNVTRPPRCPRPPHKGKANNERKEQFPSTGSSPILNTIYGKYITQLGGITAPNNITDTTQQISSIDSPQINEALAAKYYLTFHPPREPKEQNYLDHSVQHLHQIPGLTRNYVTYATAHQTPSRNVDTNQQPNYFNTTSSSLSKKNIETRGEDQPPKDLMLKEGAEMLDKVIGGCNKALGLKELKKKIRQCKKLTRKLVFYGKRVTFNSEMLDSQPLSESFIRYKLEKEEKRKKKLSKKDKQIILKEEVPELAKFVRKESIKDITVVQTYSNFNKYYRLHQKHKKDIENNRKNLVREYAQRINLGFKLPTPTNNSYIC